MLYSSRRFVLQLETRSCVQPAVRGARSFEITRSTDDATPAMPRPVWIATSGAHADDETWPPKKKDLVLSEYKKQCKQMD